MALQFAGLKSKMYSILVDDNREHKKAKGMNRNVSVTIIRICKCLVEYKMFETFYE